MFHTSANTAFTLSNHPPRKRPRESPLTLPGGQISSQLLQQSQQVGQLIFNHAEMVRTELLEHQQRCWRQALVVAETELLEHQQRCWRQALVVAEEGVSKRLRMKDEEIKQIAKHNLALEERIRGLRRESQIWRELAQSSEAEAAMLRSNLELVLATQNHANADSESSC